MEAMTRRRFLQYGAAAGAALALPWAARMPAARAAGGVKLRKYVQPVPLPGAGIVVATPSGVERVLVCAEGDRAPVAPGPAADAAVGL